LAFDSLPGETITGRVSKIAPTSITIGDVVTYAVRLDIDSSGHNLRAGMSTTATITVNELKDVIRVRNRFVRLDRKTGQATVIVPGKTTADEIRGNVERHFSKAAGFRVASDGRQVANWMVYRIIRDVEPVGALAVTFEVDDQTHLVSTMLFDFENDDYRAISR